MRHYFNFLKTFWIGFIICTHAFLTASEEYIFFSPTMIDVHLQDYNEEEKEAIVKDLAVVESICYRDKSEQRLGNSKPVYLATAGAPGSRKSTILERFLSHHSEFSQGIYVDPDQRALKFMPHTYYSRSLNALVIASQQDYSIVQKDAYEKWRPASNYIALTLLEKALKNRHDVVHGTTSTGAIFPSFIKKVKEAGYDVSLILCSCEDAFRQEAVAYRNNVQRFYQSAPEDVANKGKLFPLRMSDYFEQADSLYIYWSDDLFLPERLGAIFKDGDLIIFDDDALKCFVHKYQQDRLALKQDGHDIPTWEILVKKYKDRF